MKTIAIRLISIAIVVLDRFRKAISSADAPMTIRLDIVGFVYDATIWTKAAWAAEKAKPSDALAMTGGGHIYLKPDRDAITAFIDARIKEDDEREHHRRKMEWKAAEFERKEEEWDRQEEAGELLRA